MALFFDSGVQKDRFEMTFYNFTLFIVLNKKTYIAIIILPYIPTYKIINKYNF